MKATRENLVKLTNQAKRLYIVIEATMHSQNHMKINIFSLNKFIGNVHCIVIAFMLLPKLRTVKSQIVSLGKRGLSQ